MKLRTLVIIWCVIFSGAIYAQDEFTVTLYGKGFLSDSLNSFWSYNTTHGLVTPNTIAMGSITPFYSHTFKNEDVLTVGGSLYYAINRDEEDDWAPNQYFVAWQHEKLLVTLGARQAAERFRGLSAVAGDILWSNNARAMPGVKLETAESVRVMNNFSIDAGIAHYYTLDDRVIDNAFVHHKFLQVNFDMSSRSTLSLGGHHYAQWGGESDRFGQQPQGFGDFFEIFLGGGEEANPDVNNPQNALGNHIGSYRVQFAQQFQTSNLRFYHQSLFEDRPGFRLENFPDGVWGAFLEIPKNRIFQYFLYEYVQTTARSGGDPALGFDNYFNNSTYESGWTHFNSTIGLPFITANRNGEGVTNNVLRAHHIGVAGGIPNFDYQVKGSYVQNLGLNGDPNSRESNDFYTYLQVRYETFNWGRWGLSVGYDINELRQNDITVGLEYQYVIDLFGHDRCWCYH